MQAAAAGLPSPICTIISTSTFCARPFLCLITTAHRPAGLFSWQRQQPQKLARVPSDLVLWPTLQASVQVGAPGGRRGVVAMAAVAQPVEVLVKAASGQPDQLGDCPFSQRVLLTLEEKGIAYNAKYIDTENKPAWFLEANPEGKVPVIKHGEAWIADSDVITQLLEEQYPEPSLAVPDDKSAVGSKLFGAFVRFLKSKDPSDGTEEMLLDELKGLDDFLKIHGPYVGGDKVSAVDLSLAPKLYHLKITLAHFKKWSIPEDLTSLLYYIEGLHGRESFKKTAAPPQVVVNGWSKHLA